MSLYDEIFEFVGNQFVEREIEHKGSAKTFYIRELPAGEAEDFFSKVDPKDNRKNKGLRDRLISVGLCDSTGKDAITPEQAAKLPNSLAEKLQEAILDVNGLNKKAKEEAKKE